MTVDVFSLGGDPVRNRFHSQEKDDDVSEAVKGNELGSNASPDMLANGK